MGIKKIWVMMSIWMTNLEKETRPRNNFAEGGKLGEGGFRGVYKGLLSESNIEIAIKIVSKGSK